MFQVHGYVWYIFRNMVLSGREQNSNRHTAAKCNITYMSRLAHMIGRAYMQNVCDMRLHAQTQTSDKVLVTLCDCTQRWVDFKPLMQCHDKGDKRGHVLVMPPNAHASLIHSTRLSGVQRNFHERELDMNVNSPDAKTLSNVLHLK
jgi:hypothetical protein